jgi:predicted RNase H-related nuclease YkuK (DUF458 family)
VEIHADINPNLNMTLTKLYNKQLGTFLGMGYDFKIKPEAP